MDLFVLLQKLDVQGSVLAPASFEPGWTGPHGRLRVSHRRLDLGRSTPALLKFDWSVGPMVRNRGEHVIHSGGRYDSHLLVPIIPQ